MGACFSSSADPTQRTANVVSPSGELHRFETPVTVSEVLLHLSHISSSSSHSNKTYFLSNSDKIAYDEQIPAMSYEEELMAGIYFVFPNSSINRRLSASEMAALAVKASLALDKCSKLNKNNNCNKSKNKNGNKSKNKIIPFVEQDHEHRSHKVDEYYNYVTVKSGGFGFSGKGAVGRGLARSGSIRKLHRYSSKKAKLAVRSFRLKLGTIHEGSWSVQECALLYAHGSRTYLTSQEHEGRP